MRITSISCSIGSWCALYLVRSTATEKKTTEIQIRFIQNCLKQKRRFSSLRKKKIESSVWDYSQFDFERAIVIRRSMARQQCPAIWEHLQVTACSWVCQCCTSSEPHPNWWDVHCQWLASMLGVMVRRTAADAIDIHGTNLSKRVTLEPFDSSSVPQQWHESRAGYRWDYLWTIRCMRLECKISLLHEHFLLCQNYQVKFSQNFTYWI